MREIIPSTEGAGEREIASVLASVFSRAQSGIDAPQFTVEVHVDSGLPTLAIVRLADGAIREAMARVRVSLKLDGFELSTGSISARGYHRVLKIARTVADLDGVSTVSAVHVSEAVLFRQLDRSPPPGSARPLEAGASAA